MNGETRKPIQVQFGDAGAGLYIRGYETLFSGMDKMFADSGNLTAVVKITPKDMHCML